MIMTCKKCGHDTNVVLVLDKRGLPEAHCKACGNNIKKMSTGETIAYYEELLSLVYDKFNAEPEQIQDAEKPLCKYCTEDLFIRRGRLGTVYAPLPDAKYCPMCGREKKLTDKNY